jgi:hypothetical protein
MDGHTGVGLQGN